MRMTVLGVAALAVVSVCLAAGCHATTHVVRSGSPRPGVSPSHRARAVSYQPTVPPAVVHADRGGNRPPYTGARSQPHVDSEYPNVGTDTIDALHYGLDLTWSASSRTLSGTARIRFRATHAESQVSLDLGSPLHVAAVSLDGHSVSASHPGQKLDVVTGALAANSDHTLTVRYAGRPHSYEPPKDLRNLAGLGWNTEPDGEVWTIQEPFGAFTWFPVDDQPSDKAFYDITWHITPAWTGVSNGQLVGDSVAHGVRTTHWELSSPAASYLVTAAIGPYQEYQQTGPRGLPLTYWVTPKDRKDVAVLRQTPAMLTWLEARLGRFPLSSLGDVVVPTHSAVETQTMVTMGAPLLATPAGPTDLLHEYVHTWYGDDVTPMDWKDLWLNESFAYYVQLTWEASHGVTTTAQWQHMVDRDDQRLRTAYGPPGDPKPADFAELNVYECGARMLNRLRSMLGEAKFAAVLRDWPASRRFGSVDRDEWIDELDRVTGRNLRPFVTRWLGSTKSPA